MARARRVQNCAHESGDYSGDIKNECDGIEIIAEKYRVVRSGVEFCVRVVWIVLGVQNCAHESGDYSGDR